MSCTLTRVYSFEAAHWLPKVPDGHKCKTLHGHTFRVTVVVRGPIGDDGMVCDFAAIDALARPLIARLDHRCLNDVEGLENPTSELLAVWFCRELAEIPHLHAVRVSETERSCAEVLAMDANGGLE